MTEDALPGRHLHEGPTGALEFRDGTLYQELDVRIIWSDGRLFDRFTEWRPVPSNPAEPSPVL